MRSKANNFIGGLHNLAAIPGVIVFPLRVSCTDESLMHPCLGWEVKRTWRVRRSVKFVHILLGCMDTVYVLCVQAFIGYCTYMGRISTDDSLFTVA